MKIGMIFPGQGAQYLGMGKEFYDKERLVQELFEEASQCLDQNFVRLCFASSEKELCQTINAQTSIFLVSAAIYVLLNKKYEIVPDIVAGHSLGEYSAIFAAKGLSFPDTLYLLKKRSLFMEEATKNTKGGMLAVFGMAEEELKYICDRYDNSYNSSHVAEIVNYNSPQQLVISGTTSELEKIQQDLKKDKIKSIMLNVSGAFHSRLMKDSEKDFAQYMLKVDFNNLDIPLINNLDAKIIQKQQEVKDSLIKQLSSPILWWQSMQHLKDCDLIIEVGPGDKLSKILKKEWPDKNIVSINTLNNLADVLSSLDKKLELSEHEDPENIDGDLQDEEDFIEKDS
ncbi:ACP S-malonyltransferase [Candidatus Dependentiae bacterium]|nr:ACP S-malonyltransferase [Candidatus Dependentiae bacterium]